MSGFQGEYGSRSFDLWEVGFEDAGPVTEGFRDGGLEDAGVV